MPPGGFGAWLESLKFIEVFAGRRGSMVLAVNDMGAMRLMMCAWLLRFRQVTGIGARDNCVGGHCTAPEPWALDRG